MEVDTESGASGAESSLSPNGNADNTPKIDPIKWTVSLISNFYFVNMTIYFFSSGTRSV